MTAAPAPELIQRLAAVLRPAAQHLGIAVDPLLPALAQFAAELLRWNERINLTGARDLETLAREHLADALALVPALPAAPARWIDVGSGAGLPGLVLALARPDLEAVLLEPIEKRRAFLASTVRALGLANVTLLSGRLEDHLRAGGGAGAYDLAVARAVFPLLEWLQRGRALLRSSGVLVGLEGSTQGPLPPDAERLPYDVGLGPRAIIRVRSPRATGD